MGAQRVVTRRHEVGETDQEPPERPGMQRLFKIDTETVMKCGLNKPPFGSEGLEGYFVVVFFRVVPEPCRGVVRAAVRLCCRFVDFFTHKSRAFGSPPVSHITSATARPR